MNIQHPTVPAFLPFAGATPEAGGSDPTAGHFDPEGNAPNRGAHAFAHWLSTRSEARVALLEHSGVDVGAIDRLVSGELEPSDDLALTIARASEGAVMPADWAQPGPRWASTPVEHH